MHLIQARFVEQNMIKNITSIPTSTYIHHNHSLQYIEDWIDWNADGYEVWWYQWFLRYHLSWFSHVNMEDFLLRLDFDGKGVLHYGGGKADNNVPRNRFVPFYQDPSDINDLRSFKPFAKSGKNNGITLMLDAETYDYAISPSNSEGFILGISHHLDFELSQNYGIDIHPGQEIQIGVSTRKIVTDEKVKSRFLPA